MIKKIKKWWLNVTCSHEKSHHLDCFIIYSNQITGEERISAEFLSTPWSKQGFYYIHKCIRCGLCRDMKRYFPNEN